MAAILLIEDDLTFCRILDGILSRQGHRLTIANKGKDGIRAFSSQAFDLVLLDYRLPDANGMDMLQELKSIRNDVPVVIMTSFNDLRTAVKAIKAGALEYITKPVNPDELLMVVNQGLTRQEEKEGSSEPLKDNDAQYVQGRSEKSLQLQEMIKLVAPTNISVLIQGESGTGKENVARTIHRLSPRARFPFVAVDCGALSKELAGSELFGHVKGAFTGAVVDKIGQFEAAHKGTIFLDEVGNLSYDVQVKLLRAIQERTIQPIGSNKEIKVDVRIITATNDDLSESVKVGQFREDLFHRVNEFKLEVPSLKERVEDFDLFVNHFVQVANNELGRHVKRFSPDVRELFDRYDWPGNLRELRNVVKRAVLLTTGEEVQMSSIPAEMVEMVKSRRPTDGGAPIYDLKILQELQEKEMILKTLQEVRFNKSKAARILNIDRKTLYLKMEKYGL